MSSPSATPPIIIKSSPWTKLVAEQSANLCSLEDVMSEQLAKDLQDKEDGKLTPFENVSIDIVKDEAANYLDSDYYSFNKYLAASF